MQSGILRDPKSQRRHNFEKSVGSRSLEGSSTLGRLGLEGLLLFMYSNFIFQWINFNFRGLQRCFSPSSLISTSITHLGIILCLHLSSLTLVLYFYCLLFMFMHQSIYRLFARIYSYSALSLIQSKSNQAVIFNLGSN